VDECCWLMIDARAAFLLPLLVGAVVREVAGAAAVVAASLHDAGSGCEDLQREGRRQG
jgi:hypothetical protein